MNALKIVVGMSTSGVKKGVMGIKSEFGKLENSVKRNFSGMMAGGMAVGGGLYSGFKIADKIAEIDDAYMDLKDQVGGSMKEIMTQANALNKSLGLKSTVDASNRLIDVARKSGETGASLSQLTFQTGLLEKRFGDAEGALNAQVTLMKTFKIGVSQAGDAVGYLQSQGGDLKGELLESINEYAVQFKEAGLGLSQTIGAVSSGLQNSWNIDKTVDAFKEARLKIFAGDKSTVDAFKALGLDGLGAKVRNEEVGFSDALGMIKDKMSGLSKGDSMSIGAGLFGTQWEDAGADAIFGMISGMEKEIKTGGTIDGMTKAFEDRFSTKWNRGLSSASNAFSNLIEGMKPIVLPIIEWFGMAADKVAYFAGEFQNISKFIGVVTLGVIGMTIAFGALSLVMSVGAVAFGVLTSPITLVVAAVAGLTAGFIYLENRFGIFSNTWAALKETFFSVKASVEETFIGIQTTVGMVIDDVSMKIDMIKTAWTNFRDSLQQAFTLDNFKAFGGMILDYVLKPFESMKNSFVGKFITKAFGLDTNSESANDVAKRTDKTVRQREAAEASRRGQARDGGSADRGGDTYVTLYSRDRDAYSDLKKRGYVAG